MTGPLLPRFPKGLRPVHGGALGGGEGVDYVPQGGEQGGFAFAGAAAGGGVELLLEVGVVGDGEVVGGVVGEEGDGSAVGDGAGFGVGYEHYQGGVARNAGEGAFCRKVLRVNVNYHSNKYLQYSLIRQPLVAGLEVNDAAVSEAMLRKEVLHDEVVAVGVDADVGLAQRAEGEHGGKDAVHVREAGDAVDDVVRGDVIKPGAAVDGGVGGLGRREEGEVAGDPGAIGLYHEATAAGDIGLYPFTGRVAANPLVHIAGSAHYASGCSSYLHYGGDIVDCGGADVHHRQI